MTLGTLVRKIPVVRVYPQFYDMVAEREGAFNAKLSIATSLLMVIGPIAMVGLHTDLTSAIEYRNQLPSYSWTTFRDTNGNGLYDTRDRTFRKGSQYRESSIVLEYELYPEQLANEVESSGCTVEDEVTRCRFTRLD